MTSSPTASPFNLPRDLGNGLLLRRSCANDVDALAAFNQRIHTEDDDPVDPVERLAPWVRDLLSGRHPTHHVDDFSVVEDTHSGKIVSCMSLISQTWSYAGIPFELGRPELVATDEAFRNRGLVRTQFELIHALSAQRGQLVQAITGIPYYYRQFGYEMALDLDGNRRGFAPSHVPKLPEGQSEPYLILPASEEDIPAIQALYAQGCERSPIACVRDEAIWRYELSGQTPESINRRELRMIKTPQGELVGFLAHSNMLWWNSALALTCLEIYPGHPWAEVVASVNRYLYAEGQKCAARDGQTCTGFGYALGAQHPAYTAAGRGLPAETKSYAWYMRVPDLAAFILHIRPALEKRLANSIGSGASAVLTLCFYRSGLRIVLENGRITHAENTPPGKWMHADAVFPPLSFLQLLFGYRSLEEMRYMFADCWANEKAALLLNALFPRQSSLVWPVH